MNNAELGQKTDLLLSAITTSTVGVQSAYATPILTIMVERGVLMGLADVANMVSKSMLWPKGQFGSRFMRPGTENSAMLVADRQSPSMLTSVELTTVVIKGEADLSDEVLEDNAFGEAQFLAWIKSAIAPAVQRDVETMVLQGDTTSGDALLALQDGFLKRLTATAAQVDAADVKFTRGLGNTIKKAMPVAVREPDPSMRLLAPSNVAIDYADSVAQRPTQLGDQSLLEGAVERYAGVDIVGVPLMPTNVGTGSHCGNIIYTNPKNLLIGIWRDIRVEQERSARAASTAIIIRMRVGNNVKNLGSAVLASNVNAQ